jgi:hypothetical protein
MPKVAFEISAVKTLTESTTENPKSIGSSIPIYYPIAFGVDGNAPSPHDPQPRILLLNYTP